MPMQSIYVNMLQGHITIYTIYKTLQMIAITLQRSTVDLVLCGGGSPAVPCTVSAALLLGEGPTPLLALQV